MKKCDELSDPRSCFNKAADDELLFVLLARDEAACNTVVFWCEERIRLGLNKREDAQIQEAISWCAKAKAARPTLADRQPARPVAAIDW